MFEGKIRYFLIVLLLMAAFVATSYEVHSPDCFWHLAFGKVFVENRHFVRNEPFAFTTMGKDIYVTSWLYDFFSYLVFEHFGYSGLELSIRLLAVFVMFVLIKIATMESVEGLVHIIIYYSLFFRLFGSRFRARPESFIILLYAFLICLLFLYRKEKLKHLWLFPVVFLIWVQIHPSWVYGMLIIPLFIIEKHGFSLSKKSLKDLVFMVILPTFSLFFNPYGYKPFLFPFVSYLTMRSQSKIYSIGEWQPLKWTFFSTPFLILPIVLLLLFAFKYLKKEENLFPILFICIQTFFLLAWERYATFAFIGLSFFAFSFIGYIINMAPRFKKAIYSFSVVLLFLPYFWSITYEPYEKWVVRKFPAKECLFIKDNRIEGNLLHKYEDGGFLENSLYPSCKVYFDGRYFDFLPFYKEYVDAIRGGVKSFLAFSEKYPFEIAVLPYSFIPNYKDPENGLKRSGFIFIFPKKKWAPVFYGPYGAVFLKRTPKNEKVIEKYEYKILFPYDKDFISLSIRKGEIKEEVLKEEIERAFKTDAKFLRE